MILAGDLDFSDPGCFGGGEGDAESGPSGRARHALHAALQQRTLLPAGRNSITGPGTHQFDFPLFENLAINERVRIQLRSEMFNITNTPQFNNPSTAIGNPQAGVINSAGAPPSFQRTSRQIQLALKLLF